MEAPEVPTEHLHEELHHHAEHAEGKVKWITGVALSSAIIAALAAVASLLAGVHANEAMIYQMKASDQWNYYQAKGIKANLLDSKVELLKGLGQKVDPKDTAKSGQYRQEQKDIGAQANEKTKLSEEHLDNHEILARAVTMFQVAIAVGAVAALTRRRKYWYVSLVASVIGCYFLTGGLIGHFRLNAVEQKEEKAEATGGGEGKAKEGGEHHGAASEKHGEGAAKKPEAAAEKAAESEKTSPSASEKAGEVEKAGEAAPAVH